jgi:hypothetical protein
MFDRELDDAESSSFQRSMRRVGRAGAAALAGVIRGAQTGAVAGPWGAVTGGLAGGASRLSPPRRAAGGAPRPNWPSSAVPAPAPRTPPIGVATTRAPQLPS